MCPGTCELHVLPPSSVIQTEPKPVNHPRVAVKKNVVWPYSGPFTNSWATDSEGRQAVHEPPPSCVAVSPTQAVRESITDTAPTGGLAVGPDTKRTSPVAASEESAAAQTIANAVVR